MEEKAYVTGVMAPEAGIVPETVWAAVAKVAEASVHVVTITVKVSDVLVIADDL